MIGNAIIRLNTAPARFSPLQTVVENASGSPNITKPLMFPATYADTTVAITVMTMLKGLVVNLWWFKVKIKSNSTEQAANPIIGSGPPASRTIIEPTTPTKEAAPNFPVAHTTSKRTKKTKKSWITGRPVKAKLNGATTRLSAIQSALKMLIKAIS